MGQNLESYAWSLPSISLGYNVKQESENSAIRGQSNMTGCHKDAIMIWMLK
jgi:hypothetical protein